MAFYSLKQVSCIAALLVAAPLLCLPAAITANGMDELGTGSNPGTLAAGQSTSGNFNFVYTFGDGDQYDVTTSYSASDSGTGANLSFFVNGAYIGNTSNAAEASVAADTLNVDFLQNLAYTGPSTVSASSSATLTQVGNAPGSYSEAQLIFDNQSIGLMGPYSGPGSETFTAGPTTLNGLGATVNGDFRYTLFIAAGTNAVPEPAGFGLGALGLVVLMGAVLRRSHRCRIESSCIECE